MYIGKYDGEKIKLDPEEADAYKFVSREALRKMKKKVEPVSYKTIMEFYQEGLKI